MGGSNKSNVEQRDPQLFGSIGSINELEDQVAAYSELLRVNNKTFASSFEGEILECVHRSHSSVDGFFVNP